jgi:hypothetical protein
MLYFCLNKNTLWLNMYSTIRYMGSNKFLKQRNYTYKTKTIKSKEKYILYNKLNNTVYCSPYYKQPKNYKDNNNYTKQSN